MDRSFGADCEVCARLMPYRRGIRNAAQAVLDRGPIYVNICARKEAVCFPWAAHRLEAYICYVVSRTVERSLRTTQELRPGPRSGDATALM
jgi:hypothetical protein